MTTTPEEAWQAFIDQCVVCKGSDDGSHNDEKPAFMFAYRRALEDAEHRVIAEMVCCHIYEEAGRHPRGRGAWMAVPENKRRYRNHDLCYWAGACASLLSDRAAGVGTKDGGDDE